MEALFLRSIEAFNASLFWVMTLSLLCVTVILTIRVIRDTQEEIDE